MTLNSLTRVMWRLREKNLKTDQNGQKTTQKDLRIAIIKERGDSPQTYYRCKNALTVLGWIKCRKKNVWLTGKDLTEA